MRQPIVPPRKIGRESNKGRVGWGGRIIRPEDGPHPFGAGHGALKQTTAQSDEPRCSATDNTARQPEHRSRYPATSPKTRKPAGWRALHFWLGWQDSNLRMAGSKPAIILSIINKLLTVLTEIFPSSPFDSPSLPPARTSYEAADCPEMPAKLASAI